jgi:hypothetical protein
LILVIELLAYQVRLASDLIIGKTTIIIEIYQSL